MKCKGCGELSANKGTMQRSIKKPGTAEKAVVELCSECIAEWDQAVWSLGKERGLVQ